MIPVTLDVRTRDRRVVQKVDPTGNVFVPVPGKAVRPVYSYGPKGDQTRPIMFTCPVSAIPGDVFDLLGLWNECRLVKALPAAGGWLDQPAGVRRAFPIFEAEYQAMERRRGGTPQEAAAMATAATLKAVFGANR